MSWERRIGEVICIGLERKDMGKVVLWRLMGNKW
jgi:hypothetical protein